MRSPFILFIGAATAALAACSETAEPEVVAEPVIDVPALPLMSEVVAANAELTSLTDLFGESKANMGPFLDGSSDATLLAPTNAAFEGMEPTARDFLLAEENVASLKQVLGGHLLRQDMTAEQLMGALAEDEAGEMRLQTSNGGAVMAKMVEDELIFVDARGNEARVVEADVETENGTVHLIDTVLLPPE